VTFNHGVEGSSPSALTIEIKELSPYSGADKTVCVGTVSANRLSERRLQEKQIKRKAFASPSHSLRAAFFPELSGGRGPLSPWVPAARWRVHPSEICSRIGREPLE
jgi:hypothetical protein